MGVYKAYAYENPTDKVFVDNGRFLFQQNTRFLDVRYVDDYGLDFGIDGSHYVEKEYRTVFGPTFCHTGQMYSCDRKGLQGAIRRITCKREPTIPGLHERLVANQYRNVGKRFHKRWARWFSRKLRYKVNSVDRLQEQVKWANKADPKRVERINALRDIHNSGRMSHQTWIKDVEYKCKPSEILPTGKYLRGTGDLTVVGSTRLGYFMSDVKSIFEDVLEIENGQAKFYGSPQLDCMRECFKNLTDPPRDVFFSFYSDDSCVAARCIDGLLMANCDISACDGSNYEPVFKLLELAMTTGMSTDEDVKAAFKQLKADFFVRDPFNRKRKFRFKNKGQVLFSGSTLTTAVNNMANTLIFMQFMKKYNNGMTRAEASEALHVAAEEVGFILKVDVCNCMEKIQFLKMSPFVNEFGLIDAVMNLGVWIKNFGTFKGDLPGRTKDGIQLRGESFLYEVVRGRLNWGNHSVAEAFREKFVNNVNIFKAQHFKEINRKIDKRNRDDHWVEGSQIGRISSDSLSKRYGVETAEIDELVHAIGQARIGSAISLPIISKIMEVDYGFSHSAYHIPSQASA